MAGRTGACAQAGDLPTGPYQTSVHTEGQRQTQAAGHLNLAGSGLHDSSDAGAGADLRSRPSTGTLRLPSRAKHPTGGGRGGRTAVSRPSGSPRHTPTLPSPDIQSFATQEVELTAPVHLAFDESELGDLALSLSIGPRRGDRGADRRLVFDLARASHGSRSANDLLRIMTWKSVTISRASTSKGAPASIAATTTLSHLESPSRPVVIRRAMVRAEGTRLIPVLADSDSRISPGGRCLSECANPHTGSNQRVLVSEHRSRPSPLVAVAPPIPRQPDGIHENLAG